MGGCRMRTSYDKNAARLQFQSADMLNAYNTKLTNEANEKIAIVGDYDCDGVCSTAILDEFLPISVSNLLIAPIS